MVRRGLPATRQRRWQRKFKFEVPAGIMPGKTLHFPYRNTRFEYVVKRDDNPGDEIQVDVLRPGHEWWRGMRKGKAQLLFETGWVNPNIRANISAEWINDWQHGYKPTETEIDSKTRTPATAKRPPACSSTDARTSSGSRR